MALMIFFILTMVGDRLLLYNCLSKFKVLSSQCIIARTPNIRANGKVWSVKQNVCIGAGEI